MTKFTKALLVLCVADFAAGLLFVTGLVNVQAVPGLYVALPAGAIFFGLFLISKMLEKETAAFDVEAQAHLAAENAASPAKSGAAKREYCQCSEAREGHLVST